MNIVLTASPAHRFWSLVAGRSPHVDGDVVAVIQGSGSDWILAKAAHRWSEGVPVWPIAVDGSVEAVVVAYDEEAVEVARMAHGDLAKARPSLAQRKLARHAAGFRL